MKSRTSFFNGTVFKKNLTRFAPLWGLYTLCLMLGLVLLVDYGGLEFWFAYELGVCIQIMAVVNCGYALLVAQALFGDLYNTRMCNALHAMPLRRECWFATNMISGLVFSLLPTAIMALAAVPLLMMGCVVNGWQIALYWFLGANLEFLCFFGIAVFCGFCVGNRYAMAILYAILNFASALVYWVADALITPLFYGVVTNFDPFLKFCPVGQMADFAYMDMDSFRDLQDALRANPGYEVQANFYLQDNWWYLWVCAAVGVVLALTALLMYRKRKLECAGDFMAVGFLKPVFLVVYSLMLAGGTSFFVDFLTGMSGSYVVFAPVGLIVGWFTGQMLLNRSVRVFGGKSWLGLLGFSVVVAACFGLAVLDPLGIEEWIPETEQVESVRLSFYNSYGRELPAALLTEPEEIEDVRFIQEKALEDRLECFTIVPGSEESAEDAYYNYSFDIYIQYNLKNGKHTVRHYYIWGHEEEGQKVKWLMSRMECVLRLNSADSALDLRNVYHLTCGGYELPEAYVTPECARELLEAVQADCDAGTMAQEGYLHSGYFTYGDDWQCSSLTVSIDGDEDGIGSFEVYPDSENTIRWLQEHGGLEEYTIVKE